MSFQEWYKQYWEYHKERIPMYQAQLDAFAAGIEYQREKEKEQKWIQLPLWS